MSYSHFCPIDGCERTVADHLLMCQAHWRLVPPVLQRKVYAAYRRGEGLGTPELAEAQAAAIAAANAGAHRLPSPRPLFGRGGRPL